MPFFIVARLDAAIEFYLERLGFTKEVAIPESEPYFAIVRRDRAAIMLKEIGPDTLPQPNHTRHGRARWDGYIYSPDPLFEEFSGRQVKFHQPIADTADGLRAFEIAGHDGYVLCFGRLK
jgi:catechol 2,3-dioxygenase-like lactoylglutathione lyase family enzyme